MYGKWIWASLANIATWAAVVLAWRGFREPRTPPQAAGDESTT